MLESLFVIGAYFVLATVQWFLLFMICKTHRLTGLSNGKSCAKWASAEFGSFVRHISGLLAIKDKIRRRRDETDSYNEIVDKFEK